MHSTSRTKKDITKQVAQAKGLWDDMISTEDGFLVATVHNRGDGSMQCRTGVANMSPRHLAVVIQGIVENHPEVGLILAAKATAQSSAMSETVN